MRPARTSLFFGTFGPIKASCFVWAMIALTGCLEASDKSGSTLVNGGLQSPQIGGATSMGDPSFGGASTMNGGEQAGASEQGGQPVSAGDLLIDVKPVSGIPGKPLLELNPNCQELAETWELPHTTFEDEVLRFTNEARAQTRECGQYGTFEPVGPLYPNEVLRCAARVHSLDMVERNFFDHTNPDGVGPSVRATDAGYPWIAVGENIAAGSKTPREVVDGWLESPGHCKNIMSPDFDELGVGYTPRRAGRFTHYWTQVFGMRR